MEKDINSKTFSSKKQFLKWLEEYEDLIDWDDVEMNIINLRRMNNEF